MVILDKTDICDIQTVLESSTKPELVGKFNNLLAASKLKKLVDAKITAVVDPVKKREVAKKERIREKSVINPKTGEKTKVKNLDPDSRERILKRYNIKKKIHREEKPGMKNVKKAPIVDEKKLKF